MNESRLGSEVIAELFGTFLLVFIGNGAIAVSVLTGSYDLWAVAFMWGLGVALAVYAAGAISGAHINPAVTLAFAAFTEFEWRKVGPYIGAQALGAFAAAALIHVSFQGVFEVFEAANNLVRGEAGSQLSAMVYTTYAPNPDIVGTDTEAFAQVSHVMWFMTEVIITAVLVFGVFYLIDGLNEGRPLANLSALFIGLLVAALVAYAAPISMAALNPARDFGPRVFALLVGWGEVAFPGPRGGFWIPVVATSLGGFVGGAIYTFIFKGHYPEPAEGVRPTEAAA